MERFEVRRDRAVASGSTLWLILLAAAWSPPLAAQSSIKTTGDIETDGQLISNVPDGVPPLEVASKLLVLNLNADQVDGIEGTVLETRLTNAETLLAEVQDQVSALGTAKVPRTGQSLCVGRGAPIPCDGTGQDGEHQKGVAWPSPRFTDNGDGTVTDNLTGLIWLANASCAATAGGVTKTTTLSWADALAWTNGLTSGLCGLTDGSAPGAWRLPNVRELVSLVHFGASEPAVPDTAGTGKCDGTSPCAFSGVQLDTYWSSTSQYSAVIAVELGYGAFSLGDKANGAEHVWPVRGGQ